MVVKINGLVLEDDLYYCKIHDKWNWSEEKTCCADDVLIPLDRWAAYGVKVGRLTNADKWQFFFQR